MNKVFKVIWSEARNAYVVVSEIAKNHGSKSCSTKKLLAMLIATGVMTCASVAPVMAANPAPNDTQIAVGKDAKANGGDSVAIGKGAEAKAANGIAIGYKSLSGDRGWGVAIGGNTQAIGTHSVALGQTAKALEYEGIAIGHTSLSEGSGAIAIGRSTNAKGAASLAFGNDAKALNEASIAFGQGSNSSGNGSIAVGGSSEANGDNSIAIGNQAITSKANSVVIGGHTYKGTTGTGVTGVGQQTQVSGNYSAAFGMAASANVDRATAIGSYANAMAAGSVALGAGSTVNRKAGVQGYDPLTGDTSANTHSVWRSTKGAVSVGGVGVTRQIINVAAGSEDADAVNVAQLKRVNEEALKHTTLSDGKNTTVVPTVKDGQTDYKVNVAGDLTDISSVANGDAKLALNGAAGTAGMINGKGASVYMQDGYTVINSKVAFDQNGKISGVAAGAVTADSTDAVNGSQLHAVATEAGKHSKVVNGSNINVEETDLDGQKVYKVNLNKDIMLGDLTGKNVSISGTNGTIEATGAIVTKDRVYADNGAKLADIDVTGDKISNGASSIVLDGSNVKVNDKVTIDQNGKISGVAAGEVSKTSTDAINGSQLNQTNENVAALDKRVTQNEADIAQNKADIAQNKADIAQNKTDIKNLDNRVTNVEELAKKHTTVTAGDNIAVTESTNKDGGKEYNVALDKDINLDSVTTGQTSISNDGLKVNGKTYVSDSGLNANDQKITNVADGKVEKGSTDAVNGGQLYNETRVAKDGNFVKKSNTAGENLSALDNQVTANTESIYHMNGRISDLDNRVNKVGAGAAALAALHPLDFDPDAKWDFAAGYGNYRGANAAAVGAYYRPNEDTMFSVGGTFGNGENMVNAGVSFKLGSGSNHVSTSRVAMAKEIKELRGELEAMKSAMLDANAGKKIDTSKLQLFPDVPQNHWAYEYVAQLAGNGMIEGYPDGNFAGDRPMTRYEFAAILYRAMTKGAVLSDKILSEFSHELEYFTVDTIAKDKAGNPTIQRVRTVKENKNK